MLLVQRIITANLPKAKFTLNGKQFAKNHINLYRTISFRTTEVTKSPNNNNNLLIHPLRTAFLRHEPHIKRISKRYVMTVANFDLSEIEGDLFSAPDNYSLAHCVGADFAMGAGIAVKFKQIYGQVKELLSQGVQSGGVAVLKDKDRYIYYLVTKPQSWGSPTYDSLRSSLTAMREHMKAHNVTKLAIPRIGCGIDGLEWDKVSNELRGVFGDANLEIVVYNFVPK